MDERRTTRKERGKDPVRHYTKRQIDKEHEHEQDGIKSEETIRYDTIKRRMAWIDTVEWRRTRTRRTRKKRKKIPYDTSKRRILVKREEKIRYDRIKRRIDRDGRRDAVGRG